MWQNVIAEGGRSGKVASDSKFNHFHDMFNRWWYVTEAKGFTFSVIGFGYKATFEFPYTVFTSADYTYLRKNNEEEQKMWEDYAKAKEAQESMGGEAFMREGLLGLFSSMGKDNE